MNRNLLILVLLFGWSPVNGDNFRSVIITKDYELTPRDSTVLVFASAGPVKITLPLSTGSGQLYHIKKIEDSDEVVTVAVQGNDLIDDSTSINFVTQWAGAILQDDNPGYWDNIGSITDEDGI